MSTDAIEAFCAHAAGVRFEDLPAEAVAAAKRFILDSVGVCVSGSRGPFAAELVETEGIQADGTSRILGRRQSLRAAGAALCNAYQIHNAEFDCVHEGAVVHPMAVVLGASLAHADRAGAAGRPVTGPQLIAAVAAAVDVATGLGIASRAPLRFFRPATAGAFGAAVAVGKLMAFDASTLRHAAGITLAQLSGTMQAHVEGSPVLAMQVGFNARNALTACDLAARGVPGPAQVLEGPFGYFPLFEGSCELQPVLDALGRTWRVCEVAHKPFPSGRATHGIVDACLGLRDAHGFDGTEVERVVARVPQLTERLVGRAAHAAMGVNYARLSGPYVGAVALLRGAVKLADFEAEALADEATLHLAKRVQIEVDDNPDPNALTPIEVRVSLRSGAELAASLDTVYGNPAKPMSKAAYVEKFRSNWASAAEPLTSAACDEALRRLENLEAEADVSTITALAQPN